MTEEPIKFLFSKLWKSFHLKLMQWSVQNFGSYATKWLLIVTGQHTSSLWIWENCYKSTLLSKHAMITFRKLSNTHQCIHTLLCPIPELEVISWVFGDSVKSSVWWEICKGCRRAVAMTLRRGVAMVTWTGRGLMICWMLFLLEGAGVGGRGVGRGVGAPVWLTTTGIRKS